MQLYNIVTWTMVQPQVTKRHVLSISRLLQTKFPVCSTGEVDDFSGQISLNYKDFLHFVRLRNLIVFHYQFILLNLRTINLL